MNHPGRKPGSCAMGKTGLAFRWRPSLLCNSRHPPSRAPYADLTPQPSHQPPSRASEVAALSLKQLFRVGDDGERGGHCNALSRAPAWEEGWLVEVRDTMKKPDWAKYDWANIVTPGRGQICCEGAVIGTLAATKGPASSTVCCCRVESRTGSRSGVGSGHRSRDVRGA